MKAGAAWTLGAGCQWVPESTQKDREEGTELFFDFSMWLLVLVPLVLAIAIAAIKRKRTPELPHVADEVWDEEVVASDRPVVLHVYSTWSIGDRVIENQVKKLADVAGEQLKIRWLDVDANPGVRERYPTLEKRSVALFQQGRLLWQGIGVHDHVEILREIGEVLDSCPPNLGR